MREQWKGAFVAFIVIWTGALAISVLRLRATVCPRCGGMFHARRTGSGFTLGLTLGRQCLNCGLPVDADRVESGA